VAAVGNRSLAEAEEEAKTCRRCLLWQGTSLVYGVGRHDADLMLIGEASGEREDQLGEPFVGDSGQLLNAMLSEIRIQRKDAYIANVVKHRPTTKDGPPKNRRPSASEIAACWPWLDEQIQLIDPKLIVPLGNFAMRRFRDSKDKIGDVHGQRSDWNDHAIIPTFHPAYILRNRQKMQLYREDFRIIRRMLDSDS
jgi:uracil-DNA glycosylase family 4